jgi:hypothetical protein
MTNMILLYMSPLFMAKDYEPVVEELTQADYEFELSAERAKYDAQRY